MDGGLSEKDARSRIYPLGRPGLLVEGAEGIHEEQKDFVHPRKDVEGWQVADPKKITLEEVVRNGKITVLIGVAGKAGMFTEEAIRAMAKNTERPVIFPLSNPTSKSEATPEDLMQWTERQGADRNGQPLRAGEGGRPQDLYRSDEQFLCISWAGAGNRGGAGAAGFRRDDYDGVAGTGAAFAGGEGSEG